MQLDLDPTSPVPLYRQIVEAVRRLVARGVLRSGDKLPAVRELAVQCRVNRNTAARAVQTLEAEGIVRTRVGQGTFVAEGSEDKGLELQEQALNRVLDRLLEETRQLGINRSDLVQALTRRIEAEEKGDGDD